MREYRIDNKGSLELSIVLLEVFLSEPDYANNALLSA